MDIAKNRWRERDAGTTQLIGTGDMSLSRPQFNENTILRRLNIYVMEQSQGIFFKW